MTSRAELRDIFEMNLDRYNETIGFHVRALEGYSKVLDSGAGTGNLTLALLEQGHAVTAVDMDDPSLTILRKRCFEYNNGLLNVEKMDIQRLDVGCSEFDGVSSMFVIPLVENIGEYVSGVYDALRSGGRFSISAWAPVEDSWYRVVVHPREELTRKGVLPRYKKEFDELVESTKGLCDIVLSGPDLKELRDMLSSVGFENIRDYPKNPCEGYAYFLTCEK